MMRPAVRRMALLAHVTASVGWSGVVVVYLALAVAAITADDTGLTRSAYIAMDWLAWTVLVPFAFVSLLTGLVQALGTRWGLFRHYWVVFKLVLTLLATGVLLLYTRTLAAYGEAAVLPHPTAREAALLQSPSIVLHAAAALLVLLTATVLAIFKPRGLTPRGRRLRSPA